MNKSLGIGFLDWHGERTAKNSVNSYLLNGLFEICDQTIYFGQEGGTFSNSDCLKYGFTDRIESDVNVGIANALMQMLETCETEYFIFLENDWELITEKEVTKARLYDAMDILDQVECVRLRHRMHPGEPLYTKQFQGNELASPKHLIDCLHWRINPEKEFNQFHLIDGFHVASCAYANYTNNPCMYHTQFLRDSIIPKLTSGSNAEDDLNNWWPEQFWLVAASDGLFSHNRMD